MTIAQHPGTGTDRAEPAPRMAIPLGPKSERHVEQAELTFETDPIDAGIMEPGVIEPSRALALALRSPAAAARLLKTAVAPASPTRWGQRATPVPLKRDGRPNT